MARTIRSKQMGAAATAYLSPVIGIILIVVGGTVLKDVAPTVLQGVDFNLGMVVASIGTFMVAIPVLNSLFGKVLKASIEERNENLERTFSEAESLKKEMADLRTSYEQKLAKAESDAREQIQTQIREAQKLRQTLVAEAAERADEMVRKAESEIEAERQRMLTGVRTHVVELTLSATERLVGKNVDDSVNRQLVTEFLQSAKVAD